MDPEQIYQEVLAEEQKKGVSASVAEGRAKAARVRAEHGSPHPKEPKWWPGAQPHLEGGEPATEEPAEPAAPEAKEEVAEEPAPAAQAPAEAPAAAPPAAEAAPEPEAPVAEPAQVPQQAPAAPAQPVAPAAAGAGAPGAQTAPTAPAAAATATELPPERRPAGVTHGTATGTRLRPEDEVTTDAQFEGQRAMYARRKLIDELVATGVPAVSAADTGRPRAPLLVLLYLLIPLVAIGVLASQDEESAAGGNGAAAQPQNEGIQVVAEDVSFDTDTITLPANKETTITFDNRDSVQHNIAIYENENAEEALFTGEIVSATTVDYTIPEIPKGEYFFRCDVHPDSMTGTVIAE